MTINRGWKSRALYTNLFVLTVILVASSLGAQAQTDPADRLLGQQLSGDFFLRYHVSIVYNDSPQVKAERDAAIRRTAEIEIKSGKVSRAEVDKGLAEMKASGAKQIPPRSYTVILTGHHGMLRMESADTEIPMIVIYDGKQTFTCFPGQNNVHVDNNFLFQNFQNMPIPGVGLPSLPLIKLPVKGAVESIFRGELYTGAAMSQAGEPMYLPGTVEVQPGPASTLRVVTMISNTSRSPYQRWDFQGTKLVHAQPLATFIRKVQFDLSNPEKARAGHPDVAVTTEYTLLEANEKPVPDKLFDPYTLVKGADTKDPYSTGTIVQWNGEPRIVAFDYKPGKTLKEQRDEQLEELNGADQEAEQQRRGQRGWTGPILIGVIVSFGGYWLIRRKRLARA